MSQDQTTGDDLQGKGTDASTPPTYKEQLDEAATKVKDPQSGTNEGGVIGQVVEQGKICSFRTVAFYTRLIDMWPSQYPSMSQPWERS